MFVELQSSHACSDEGTSDRGSARAAGPCRWTVVIPFFNERDYLPATLRSLARQTVPFHLVLVDNDSTDGSSGIAAAECRRLGLPFTLVHEQHPGKVRALAAGLAAVRSELVATADADTLYPADYLARAQTLLDKSGVVVAGAYYAPERASRWLKLLSGLHICMAGWLLAHQCHAGGAGQAFRTSALRRAGGFDHRHWNLVLEDHEIIHRVGKFGRVAYGLHLWCSPSARERNRDSIRWSLVERLVYHLTPALLQHRFFYDFLAPRLIARRLSSESIRERPFQQTGTLCVASHSVCR